MLKRFFIVISLISFIFILQGCGGYDAPLSGEYTSPPEDGSITINPSTIKIKDASGPVVTDREQFQIVVTNADGIPLDNVEVVVSYPWAVPSPAGFVQFYDGDTPVDSPMTVVTDQNGTYIVKFNYLRGGISYEGEFQFISGSLYGSATFKVETGS